MINYVSYEYTIFFVFLLIGIPALVAMLFKNKHIFKMIKKEIYYVEKHTNLQHYIYYVLIIFIMNVVFFNCSLGNFLGGYVFGLKMGTFLTVIGCMLAAMVSFYISRDLLKDFFTNMFKKNSIFGSYYKKVNKQKLDDADTIELVALSRLSPQAPFQLFNLFWGTMNVEWYNYFIGTLALIPIVTFETFIGTQIKNINKLFKSENKFTFIVCLLITGVILWLVDKKTQDIINKQIDKKN